MSLISVGLLSLTGCGYEPPAKAEREVKAAKQIIQIDSSLLNQWFHEKNVDGKDLPIGSVACVGGKIVETKIEEVKKNGSRDDSKSEVVVYLELPEYAAVVLECRFHTTHVAEVNSLERIFPATFCVNLDNRACCIAFALDLYTRIFYYYFCF